MVSTLRCPIRNALFSSIHLADIKAQWRSGPLIRDLHYLFVNQQAGELRWASHRLRSDGKKINVKQIDYTYFIKFWFNECIIKPFSSRLIQFGPSLVAYCLRLLMALCHVLTQLIIYGDSGSCTVLFSGHFAKRQSLLIASFGSRQKLYVPASENFGVMVLYPDWMQIWAGPEIWIILLCDSDQMGFVCSSLI